MRYVVEKFLQRKIPVSAFVFDSPWETAYNDLTFNLKDGPAPDPSAQFGKDGAFEDQPDHPTQDFAGFKTFAEMMRFLQTSGLKVICWMAPFTNDESSHDEKAGEANEVIAGQKPRADNFDTGTAAGAFVRGETDGTKAQNGSPRPGIHWWKGHGSHFDFTNPAARAWLKGQIVKLIDACRVPTKSGTTEPALCGFKTDDGEAQTAPKANNNPTGVYLSTDAKYSDPSLTAAEMRNHYSVAYHEAVHTILTDAVGLGKGMLFSRGGFHGSQAFPGCWAGDNIAKFDPTNGLPSVVTAGLSAALSGFSIWGHDVGGYQKVYEPPPTDVDLFIRWTQFGCFSPIMQMHRQLSDGPPNVSHPHGQYPWGYVSAAERADPANHGREFVDNEALRNYRFYAELHTRLFPYLYTFAKESSETGLPILRPLVLMHQDDPMTFGIDHTYYFGSELLVAPIVEPNRTARTVYLPRGVWIDFWTNERIDRSAAGSDHAWSNADRSKLPVFARDGAIVPMLLDLPQTLCDADYVNNDAIRTAGDGLLVRIYPAESSRFVVYDGTEITCQMVAGSIQIGVSSPITRPVRLSVLAAKPPAGVTRDGATIDERDDVDVFNVQSSAWRHDAATGFLEIKFPLSTGSTTVRVSLIQPLTPQLSHKDEESPMANPWNFVPDWNSFENQGGGVAAIDLDGDGRSELIVLRVDHPNPGPNRGFYRVGKALDATGAVTGAWGDWIEIPAWESSDEQGANLAVAALGDAHPALVVVRVDHRVPGPNVGQYRVGRGLDADGKVTGGWGPWIDVPDWNADNDDGVAVTVGDLDADGRPEIIVFHIENVTNPDANRPNRGWYRVGKSLDSAGNVTGGWGSWHPVDWSSWFNQGAGLALADLDNNGNPELIVFQVDDPDGENNGLYRIGWNLNADGVPVDGWGAWVGAEGWGSFENQGGGLALASFAPATRPKAILFQIDNPAALNRGMFRADDFVIDLDDAKDKGVWRLLPFFSEVLPVHAAVLHTGKVLFFAGSGNNAFRFNSPDFGNVAKGIFTSVVWDPASGTFSHPATAFRTDGSHRPIDFFCGGHCFLPDGRILVAGGSLAYDTDIVNGQAQPANHGFKGTRDALIFDPAGGGGVGAWTIIQSMAHGRWYPTLLMLGDGRVVAFSGLDEKGANPLDVNAQATSKDLEINDAPDTAAWRTTREFRLPLYPHLFLLRDGGLFHTGGKMDSDGDSFPMIFDPLQATGAVGVGGLTELNSCNQSASVILPPAQSQKFMIIGGGPEDENEATDRVAIADLSAVPANFIIARPMHHVRIHVNAVLLPDRTVFATGGAARREAGAKPKIDPNPQLEEMIPEIFDPNVSSVGQWTEMATATVPRLYHSVALLLPDGRVVAAGGNPSKGSHVPWLPPDPVEEERLEIYSPPYLFRGPRPEISAAPSEAAHGDVIVIHSPQADRIRNVSLVRPGLTTHSFNVEQRLVDVPSTLAAGVLKATVPAEKNIAPPGWYMLFVTDKDGIPSIGHWILLS